MKGVVAFLEGVFLCHVVAYLKILKSVTICLFGKEKSKNEYLFDSIVTHLLFGV